MRPGPDEKRAHEHNTKKGWGGNGAERPWGTKPLKEQSQKEFEAYNRWNRTRDKVTGDNRYPSR